MLLRATPRVLRILSLAGVWAMNLRWFFRSEIQFFTAVLSLSKHASRFALTFEAPYDRFRAADSSQQTIITHRKLLYPPTKKGAAKAAPFLNSKLNL
jgi:hypothetical protein